MNSKFTNSINKDLILKVINKMTDTFYTKDISSHQLMINGHPELFKHTHYHSFIGRYLKNNLKDSNGKNLLIELRTKTIKGSLWQKAKTFQKENTNQKIIGDKVVSGKYESYIENHFNDPIKTNLIDQMEIGPQCKLTPHSNQK